MGIGPYQRAGNTVELHTADSTLTISSVASVTWTFQNIAVPENSKELWIYGIDIAEASSGAAGKVSAAFQAKNPKVKEFSVEMPEQIVIDGDTWSLTVHAFEPEIVLRDLETPYLFSKRNRKKSRA